MGKESFSLYAAARNVTRMLRSRLEMDKSGQSTAELHAAIEEIHALWEELQAQSAELASERQRFEEFFEYAPEAYVITETNGAIREANKSARDLLGLKDEAGQGLSLADLVSEAQRPGFRAMLIAVRGHPEGVADQFSTTLLTQDGRTLLVTLGIRPVKVRRKNAGALCWLIRPSDAPTT